MADEETTIVALLHDVVEDSDYQIDDLRKMGFGETVLSAIQLMTHDPDVDYMQYVAQIQKNPLARTVKLADLNHNRDLSRLDRVTPQDEARAEKYQKAIELLENSQK